LGHLGDPKAQRINDQRLLIGYWIHTLCQTRFSGQTTPYPESEHKKRPHLTLSDTVVELFDHGINFERFNKVQFEPPKQRYSTPIPPKGRYSRIAARGAGAILRSSASPSAQASDDRTPELLVW
jgi:hypothetical protein